MKTFVTREWVAEAHEAWRKLAGKDALRYVEFGREAVDAINERIDEVDSSIRIIPICDPHRQGAMSVVIQIGSTFIENGAPCPPVCGRSSV